MSNNVKEYSELKKRAMLAKQRMSMGYWRSMSEEKAKALSEVGLSYLSVQKIKDMQLAKFERDVNKNLGSPQALQDEIIYKKVCDILDKDENVSNPIGLLVDHKIYDVMDEANKQRYILELSKKFREMRDRYYQERLNKSC